MIWSHGTLFVCLTLVVIVVNDARTVKQSRKTSSSKKSSNFKDLWPFTAYINCDSMATLDVDFNYEHEHKTNYDLQSWPNCGLNRFSPHPGDTKLRKKLRSFQEYLSEIMESVREVRTRGLSRDKKYFEEDDRIVGGNAVESGRWPWLAIIGKYMGTPFCGGTVIADRWIITAAHCFDDMEVPCQYTVRVGATQWLTDPEGLGQDSEVEAIYRHPGYVDDTHENDIALLKLKDKLWLDSDTNSNAICLPDTGRSALPGTMLRAAGWGLQGEGKPSTVSMEAREVSLPLIGYDGKQCGEYPDSSILKGMLCAGYTQGGKDTCQGDSGGPLIFKKDGKWHQLGVTSFGAGCAQKNFPGVYTDVGQYRDWIASCMGRNS